MAGTEAKNSLGYYCQTLNNTLVVRRGVPPSPDRPPAPQSGLSLTARCCAQAWCMLQSPCSPS